MAQGDLTPQAIHRLQRYSNTAWMEHRDFSYGMCQDLPSYASPETSVWDSQDYLYDIPGKLRKRGGIKGPFSGTQSLKGYSFVRVANPEFSADRMYVIGADSDTRLWKASDGTTVNGTTTAGTNDLLWGRPIEHFGFTIVPARTSNANTSNPWVIAGSKFTTGAIDPAAPRLLGTPATVAIATGNPVMTIAAGDTAKFEAGQIVRLITASSRYDGRVMSVSGTSVKLWPVPTVTFAAGTVTAAAVVQADSMMGYYGTRFYPMCGTSFQNRIVYGDIRYDYSGQATRYQQRITWSILPTESVPTNDAFGATYLTGGGFPTDNYIDLPSAENIVALEPISDGDLVVFTPSRMYRLTGNLVTQTAQTSGVGVDIHEAAHVGCMDDMTVAKTPRGIVFASREGVFLYDGSQLRPLFDRRIQKLWDNLLLTGGPLFGWYAYNHYAITLSTNETWICYLPTLAWGRLSGGCSLLRSVLDAGDGVIWGLRYNNTGGSFVGGQVMQVSTMFNPSSTNRSDGDGTAVAPTLKTRSYVEGDPNTKKRFRRVQVEYDLRGAGTLTVASDTKLKVADASYVSLSPAAGGTTIGTTTSSGEVTFDSMSKLTKGYAVEHSITQTGGSDSTEILSIKHGVQMLRDGRS